MSTTIGTIPNSTLEEDSISTSLSSLSSPSPSTNTSTSSLSTSTSMRPVQLPHNVLEESNSIATKPNQSLNMSMLRLESESSAPTKVRSSAGDEVEPSHGGISIMRKNNFQLQQASSPVPQPHPNDVHCNALHPSDLDLSICDKVAGTDAMHNIVENGFHDSKQEYSKDSCTKTVVTTNCCSQSHTQTHSSTDDDGSQQTLSSSINSDSEVNDSVCSDKGNCLNDPDLALNDEDEEQSESIDDDIDSGLCSGGSCQCSAKGLSKKSNSVCSCKTDEIQGNSTHVEVQSLLDNLEKTSLVENIHECKPLDVINGISYVVYESERQMPDIMRLITKDLSEPYSIYTYRYFIHNWPKLCFLAMADNQCVGAIVCKLDLHKKMVLRGYIAMLAVDSEYRRRQIGSTLVTKAIQAMIRDDCGEVVLETEITNKAALHLYENLGFVRDKRLFRYYLNGVDALRLKLWLR